ncbi:MAG: type II toxin-antitoxin system VapC family toxin [Candidatus Omnitrophica bacterium]|nr:type II toxin-antitoxin system VapC family toxin [Candidatus Omnitrophota bacterium]
MKRVFVDTSFLFAYHYDKDPYHVAARNVVNEKVKAMQPLQWVVTDYIFDELMTVIQKFMSKESALEVGKRLFQDRAFDFKYLTSKDFEEAWAIFQRYQDKQWSFTDCTSYVWIRDNQPDYYLATDDDFNQFGISLNLMGF